MLFVYMETYKIIPSLPVYEISQNGNVRRVGSIDNLKPCLTSGYPSVSLWVKGKQYRRYVHRLMGEAYLGDCKSFQINHIDSNRLNNNLNNLEIVTSSGNNHHAYKSGLRYVTTKQKNALLKNVSKEVVDLETGTIYPSLSLACTITNTNYNATRKRIMRKSKNIRFEYTNCNT
jgi:hypothetical protein